ncbi:MAG: TIGR02099 family protein, partial [Rhodocyclaceae bacterium]|nr:TIGR02099 family protein [Rhodocyclaceae bacterium]
VLSLQSRNAALELPTVFADPRLDLEHLVAQANWTSKDGRIEVQLQNLSFDNKDAAGSASGRYRSSPDGPGEIDLTARLNRGEGAAVWRYMPLVVNRDVRDWLRASISGGHADDVRLRLQGDLKDFPFAGGKMGIFRVTAKFNGAKLRYAPDWPGIDNIAGDLLFEGRRMLIRAERGSIYGVNVSSVSAEIADLEAPEEMLAIAGRAEGPTADFLRFIDDSPVASKIDQFTEGMSASGKGSLALKLALPLRRLDDSRIEGDFRFIKNRLMVDPDLPPLTEVDGRLQFTGGSVSLKEARANLLGSPVAISALTRADGTVAINASGNLSIAALRKSVESPLLEHLSGSTPWSSSILVRKKSAEVAFESSLQGIASSLPEPFNKTAAEALPLRIERGAFAEAPPREAVRLTLGKAINAQVVRRREAGKVTVERGVIGIGEAPALPDKGVLLAGNLKSLNVDFWRNLFSGNGGAPLPVTSVNLRAGEVTAFDRSFADVSLRAALQDDTWQAQVASKEVTGDFAWKAQGQGRLRARLRQLILHESRSGKDVIAEEPLRELPGLDIVADNFSLRGKKLGRLELQAVN